MSMCRCGKRVGFPSQMAAELALMRLRRREKRDGERAETRSYRCGRGRWHLTSQDSALGVDLVTHNM